MDQINGILPMILKNPSPSFFLINFNFFLSHTADFNESLMKALLFHYLALQLLGFYFLYFLYTSNSKTPLFHKYIKVSDELLKSLDFDFFFRSCHNILLTRYLLKQIHCD